MEVSLSNIGIVPPTGEILWAASLIFALRVADVTLGTVRTMMIMRSRRSLAALLGFVEVTIWVVAISQVITHLDSLWNILGYSGGFATGTMLGMWIVDRLALGYVNVNVISVARGPDIAQGIRAAGYGATQLQAKGKSGPVSLINTIVPRKQVADLIHLVDAIDSASFVTFGETWQVTREYSRLGK